MGLLDSLGYGNQGGYGGLLDALLYPSPLNKPEEVQQPQYDAMGNYTGITPQTARDPFGPIPQANLPPASSFLPPSIFNGGGAPIAGLSSGTLQPANPQSSPPAAPPPPVNQVNDINVGGYQMPRLGSIADYTPQAAPTDVSAQSRPQPQGQPQQLPPAFGGSSYLERLNAGGGLIGSLLGDTTQQKNAKAQYDALVPILGPQKAMLAVMNPKAAEIMLTQAFGNKEPPKTVEEFAVRNAWENRNGTAARGAGGGTVAGSSAGSGLPTTLEGLEKYKTDQKAAEKRATTIAEKQGEAAASLPDTLARAEQTIKQIDELKSHPAKGYRTGFSSIVPSVPGFGGVDFDERVKQIKGGAFLDAYKMLRGTGAISEAEGAKAEQAQARLSQSKNQKDFDQALDDLRSVVVAGYERAQKTAGEEKTTPYQMPVGQARTFGGVTIKRIN